MQGLFHLPSNALTRFIKFCQRNELSSQFYNKMINSFLILNNARSVMFWTEAEKSSHHNLSIVLLHGDAFNKYINSLSINISNSYIRHFPPCISLFSVNAIIHIRDVYKYDTHRHITNVPSTLWHILHKCSYTAAIAIDLKQRTRYLVDFIPEVCVSWQQKPLIQVHRLISWEYKQNYSCLYCSLTIKFLKNKI